MAARAQQEQGRGGHRGDRYDSRHDSRGGRLGPKVERDDDDRDGERRERYGEPQMYRRGEAAPER
jgi:hypothetical protein